MKFRKIVEFARFLGARHSCSDQASALQGLHTSRRVSGTERGRSMVEMLGVLAIIGVLSITGIAGYSMLMERYRNNELSNELNILAISVSSQMMAGSDPSFEGREIQGYTVSLFASPSAAKGAGYEFGVEGSVPLVEDKDFALRLAGVPQAVCNHMVQVASAGLIQGLVGLNTNPITAGDCADLNAENPTIDLFLIYNADLARKTNRQEDTPVDETKECSGRGKAMSIETQTGCLCKRGYSGTDCLDHTDACNENGVWFEGSNVKRCICDGGFIGAYCENFDSGEFKNFITNMKAIYEILEPDDYDEMKKNCASAGEGFQLCSDLADILGKLKKLSGNISNMVATGDVEIRTSREDIRRQRDIRRQYEEVLPVWLDMQDTLNEILDQDAVKNKHDELLDIERKNQSQNSTAFLKFFNEILGIKTAYAQNASAFFVPEQARQAQSLAHAENDKAKAAAGDKDNESSVAAAGDGIPTTGRCATFGEEEKSKTFKWHTVHCCCKKSGGVASRLGDATTEQCNAVCGCKSGMHRVSVENGDGAVCCPNEPDPNDKGVCSEKCPEGKHRCDSGACAECCKNSDCPGEGLECPMGGGQCQCADFFHEQRCGNKCISNKEGSCCTEAIGLKQCPGDGTQYCKNNTCVCANGLIACANGSCSECCSSTDCGDDKLCSKEGKCEPCPDGQKKCGNECIPSRDCCPSKVKEDCGEGQICTGGKCACINPNQQRCGKKCIDTCESPMKCDHDKEECLCPDGKEPIKGLLGGLSCCAEYTEVNCDGKCVKGNCCTPGGTEGCDQSKGKKICSDGHWCICEYGQDSEGNCCKEGQRSCNGACIDKKEGVCCTNDECGATLFGGTGQICDVKEHKCVCPTKEEIFCPDVNKCVKGNCCEDKQCENPEIRHCAGHECYCTFEQYYDLTTKKHVCCKKDEKSCGRACCSEKAICKEDGTCGEECTEDKECCSGVKDKDCKDPNKKCTDDGNCVCKEEEKHGHDEYGNCCGTDEQQCGKECVKISQCKDPLKCFDDKSKCLCPGGQAPVSGWFGRLSCCDETTQTSCVGKCIDKCKNGRVCNNDEQKPACACPDETPVPCETACYELCCPGVPREDGYTCSADGTKLDCEGWVCGNKCRENCVSPEEPDMLNCICAEPQGCSTDEDCDQHIGQRCRGGKCVIPEDPCTPWIEENCKNADTGGASAGYSSLSSVNISNVNNCKCPVDPTPTPEDPCEGVVCEPKTHCEGGDCVPDSEPTPEPEDPCSGITCGDNETCVDGHCECQGWTCGTECIANCTGSQLPDYNACKCAEPGEDEPEDPCEGVVCEPKTHCEGGDCVPDSEPTPEPEDPCEGVVCDPRTHCEGGDCVPDSEPTPGPGSSADCDPSEKPGNGGWTCDEGEWVCHGAEMDGYCSGSG